MGKLWEKDWKLDKAVEAFETKGDMEMDQKLAEFDVYCSIAQVKMLNKMGILSPSELKTAKKGLLDALSLIKAGKFKLGDGDEDIHTKIENFITERYGEVGKKMHTGRSRSDQAVTDVRLYTKRSLLEIWAELISLAEGFSKFAKKYEFMPMPGYTHMQKAMLSSVGMWASAFAESFLDDLVMLKAVYEINNRSPLGSAASYGVPLNLDREYAAELLGFGGVQKNSLYCHNSRTKIESETISALAPILMDINRFASDVMLFTTSEFNYFSVDKELCSGSSIMPQKKNVDVAELLRSKIHIALGYYIQSASLPSNLVSGYSREVQEGKRPLFESMEIATESLKVANILLNGITPNEEAMRKGLTPEVFAAQKALELTVNGEAFRDAYKSVGKDPKGYMPNDMQSALKKSKHTGGTGNLGLSAYSAQIKSEKGILGKEVKKYRDSVEKLVNG